MDSASSSKSAVLLQSLEQFVALISGGLQQGKGNSASTNKSLCLFLRLNLLARFRRLQNGEQEEQGPHRDVLTQWWITLLNFLNSDLNGAGSRQGTGLFVETISVALECISRVITLLQPTAGFKQRDFDIYSHHLLLTVHYITNRLVHNSKKRRLVNQNTALSASQVKAVLVHTQASDVLLRSFMGKVVAYSYFYLPNTMRYDLLVLRFLCDGNVRSVPMPNDSIVYWKPVCYQLQTGVPPAASRAVPEELKLFQVMISYLQDSQVFMTFYWHIWYIVIELHLAAGQCEGLNIDHCPGLSILMDYVGRSITRDLPKFTHYMRTDKMGEPLPSSINNAFSVETRFNNTAIAVTTEDLNNYIYTKFESVKLWECIRNLVGCFRKKRLDSVETLLHAVVREHDSKQLEYISKFSAYESTVGNVVYNKLFQFILFQFTDCTPRMMRAFNWSKWLNGIKGMLSTLNGNCQTTALICLFNIWDLIEYSERVQIRDFLLNDLWDNLTLETGYRIAKVIFMKLLVFKIVPDKELDPMHVREKLMLAYNETMELTKYFDINAVNEELQDVLILNGGRKLVLFSYMPVAEEDLILQEHRRTEKPGSSSQQSNLTLFPYVSSLYNVRPSVVAMKGRYPYEVFDEMVTKAVLILAEKKTRSKSEMISLRKITPSGVSSSDAENGERAFTEPGFYNMTGVASAWSSLVSKISPYGKMAISSSTNSSCSSMSSSQMTQRHDPFASSDSLDSEFTEMVSICSTVSQLSGLTFDSLDENGYSVRQRGSATLGLSSSSSSRENSASTRNKKKRKLLAPPELKFSSDITEKVGISHIFRLTITPQVGAPGAGTSVASKIRQANLKWGSYNSEASAYDKPLPMSPNMPVSETNTLIDGFDFESLTSTTYEGISQLKPTEISPRVESKKPAPSPKITKIPNPNWGFLSFFDRQYTNNCQNEEDVFSDLTIADISPAESLKPGIKPTLKPALHGKGAAKHKDGVLPKLVPNEDLGYTSPCSEMKKKRTIDMYQNTRMGKLAQVILTYNETVEEYFNYLNVISETGEVGDIFMELDVATQINRNSRQPKDSSTNALAVFE
ncbi:HCL212Cp [Eremothecium sinecaudum]|uniref:HCL212Cp n=1 Tax=Eremothecium sinecaudum TaxID=45286 RepID=A0A0X8HR65_9SACH|nr:HCL212Cp [Eremothecium sinecaudum]AMD19939.1 HCL212Cp [Eremothecium sinecaudum]